MVRATSTKPRIERGRNRAGHDAALLVVQSLRMWSSSGAALVGPQHLDLITLPADCVAGPWNSLEIFGHESTDRGGRDLRVPRYGELRAQLAQIDRRANDERSVVQLLELAHRQIALVENVADNLFEHVFQRRDALHGAILIDDDRKVAALILIRA